MGRRRDGTGCPCGECQSMNLNKPSYGRYNVRNCPATEQELALLRKARRTTDPRKLAAMMPTWLRSALKRAEMPAPWVFVPDKKPVYPRLPSAASFGDNTGLDPYEVAAKAGDDYIAAFDRARGFAPVQLWR